MRRKEGRALSNKGCPENSADRTDAGNGAGSERAGGRARDRTMGQAGAAQHGGCCAIKGVGGPARQRVLESRWSEARGPSGQSQCVQTGQCRSGAAQGHEAGLYIGKVRMPHHRGGGGLPRGSREAAASVLAALARVLLQLGRLQACRHSPRHGRLHLTRRWRRRAPSSLQEVVWRGLLGGHTARFLRSRLKHLRGGVGGGTQPTRESKCMRRACFFLFFFCFFLS